MGNKNQRVAKVTAQPTRSPTSSTSSGTGIKTLTKNSAQLMAGIAGKIVDVKVETAKGLGMDAITEFHLPFRSMMTNTLPETHTFRAHNWKPAEKPKTLSIKPTASLPGVGPRSARNSGPPGMFGSTRHNKPPTKPSAAVAKIQGLLSDIKPFPASTPNSHGKKVSSDSKDTLLSLSGIFAWTLGYSSPPKPQPLIDIRVNKYKQDLVINANSVYRNRVNNCVQRINWRGKLFNDPPEPLNPSNVLSEIAELDEAGKKQYWESNALQIEVDLTHLTTVPVIEKDSDDMEVTAMDKGKGKEVAGNTSSVLDQLARLGPDFYEYATNIHVKILFPAPAEGSIAPRGVGKKNGKLVYPDYKISVNTPGFAILEKLVDKLDKVTSIQYLEVVLHNIHASTTVPFTLEQLYYGLPFYDLHHKDWKLTWLGNYMTQPCGVGDFPLHLLDNERNKWLWEIRKAYREGERVYWEKERAKERNEPLPYANKSDFIGEDGNLFQPYDIKPAPKPVWKKSVPKVAAKVGIDTAAKPLAMPVQSLPVNPLPVLPHAAKPSGNSKAKRQSPPKKSS